MIVFRARMQRRRRHSYGSPIADYNLLTDEQRQQFNAGMSSMFAATMEFLAIAEDVPGMPLAEWPRADFIGFA